MPAIAVLPGSAAERCQQRQCHAALWLELKSSGRAPGYQFSEMNIVIMITIIIIVYIYIYIYIFIDLFIYLFIHLYVYLNELMFTDHDPSYMIMPA